MTQPTQDVRQDKPAPSHAANAGMAVASGDDFEPGTPWMDDCLRQVAAGDAAALARMMRVASPRLLRLAQAITRDPSDAEEAVNDAWRQVWRHAGSFDPRRAPAFGWLVAIVQRQAIDVLRRRDARARIEADVDATLDAPPSAADPAREVEARQGLSALRRAMLRLTTRRRTAVTLAVIEQHSHSEIARRTGTPLGTVKTRVREALRALRAMLPH
ncbi:MAG: RNA polymerase sigma factor [Xanthomonadaceae bacterium]|jgi:RNA polymerase sigma-70 factor (ECF subfamily)|nr:RNA polymerase sigma factor [Xanthomonadaceae bacterium]